MLTLVTFCDFHAFFGGSWLVRDVVGDIGLGPELAAPGMAEK
jgi:hypothetical protein